MAKVTSATKSRGYTLVECLIASVLLSVSVLAVGGAFNASYAQEKYASERRAALESGAQLLDEVSALPIDAAAAGNPSIMGYANYTDQASIDNLSSIVSGATAAVDAAGVRKATRRISVKRKATPNGSDSSTGDFAIVGIQVDNGSQSVSVSRLVTSAEANAIR